jgi:hypothetical protein
MSDQEKIFTEGLIFTRPKDGAPEYIKGGLSIKVDEFVAFLNKHKKPDGWVNLDFKKSQGGKLYFQLNSWTPPKKDEPVFTERTETQKQVDAVRAIDPEDIPF